MSSSYWEKVYQGPLENISWNRAQADYFKHLVDEGKIKGSCALDIGCGMGFKSVYLAENGFKEVAGVDISPTAIKYCRALAEEKGVAARACFAAGDLLDDLPLLDGRRFDFILDWAALHCIERSYHPRYLEQILNHSKTGSLYLLRVFSSENQSRDYFIDKKNGAESKVCIMQRDEVEGLFCSSFEILEFKLSKPHRHDGLRFIEFFMRRK